MRDLLWERGEDEVGLMVKPLPCPLVVVLKDKVRMKAIQDHPELLKIICQIEVDVLDNLLKDHPNGLFV